MSTTFYPVADIICEKLLKKQVLTLSWGYLMTGDYVWYLGYWTSLAEPIGTVNFGNYQLTWPYMFFYSRLL